MTVESRRNGWRAAGVSCLLGALILILFACSDRHRTLPIVSVFTPASPAHEMITIRHILRDRSSTSLTIEVSYRVGLKDPWLPATEGTGSEGTSGLRATPGGVNHIYVWDSIADLGDGVESGVQIRMLPRRQGKRGTVGRTGQFRVDNTGIFVDSFIDTIMAPCLTPLDSRPFGSRDRHTVTAIPGGRVLIAGGVDALGDPLSTAEIFDPWTGCYESLGAAMQFARESHAAVALGDGRVLLIGGMDAVGMRDDAEIFRWDTRSFATVGTLSDPKIDFTATLLEDGRVLIAGGFDGAAPLSSADIFTPSSPGTGGTIVPALNPLLPARRGHFAVPLEGGEVLIGGGADAGGLPVSGEIFDPVGETFTDTGGPMVEARSFASAAPLADGTVAILGGRDPMGAVLDSGEIYDPLLDQFTAVASTPPPPSPREFAAGHSVPGGNAVFVGGSDGTQGVLTADLYVLLPGGECATASAFCEGPGTMTSPRLRPVTTAIHDGRIYVAGGGGLPEFFVPPGPTGGETITGADRSGSARADHTMTTLQDGQVLVAGGADLVGTTATAELFDPVSETFVPTLGSLGTPRQDHTATLLPDGTVLIAGGSDGVAPLGGMEIYDPQSGNFTATPNPLTDARLDHTASLLWDGTVLIAGGEGTGGVALDTAEIYDPASGSVTLLVATLTAARRGHRAAILHDGNVFLAAGIGSAGIPIASVEVYDTWSRAFTNIPDTGSVLVPRHLHEALTLPNGRVLIIGGEDDAGATLTSTTIFDPVTAPAMPALFAGPEMDRARSDFTAAVFPEGDVLVAGGFSVTQNFPRVEVFDIRAFAFRDNEGGNLISARRGAPGAILRDRRLLILGGRNNQDTPLDRAEIYSP